MEAKLIQSLLAMPRSGKKYLFLSFDTLLVVLSLFAAMALRFGTIYPAHMTSVSWWIVPIMAAFGPIVIAAVGLHRIKLHAIESDGILRIAMTAALLSMAAIATSYMLRLSGPRSVPLIFGAVFFMLSVTSRMAALFFLRRLDGNSPTRLPVIIYGAGAAGIQLAMALRQSVETRPILFVDDNPNLHDVMVSGLKVYPPSELPRLIAKNNIARILLAIPSLSEVRRAELIAQLTALPVDVQVLPSFIELMAARGGEDTWRSVSPDELLDRDKVDLNTPEIAKAYTGRTIMVTGAGGSIGAELCRQLINCKPKTIVLFEQSEFALYSIERELGALAGETDIKIIARLGSIINRARVENVVAEDGVEIILHAAAYKHVPLVEDNEVQGAENNVIGTKVVADVANAAGIKRFILVSTDKAVRPTNIMGATKRMAELIVQDMQTRSDATKFAMVRFGNVLGSSGSVLPLFQAQIENGGPVTVTHPDVTRFFMTIPESARLVLLAGAYATGGDVFVLDMGKPQRILDVAERMIRLSGRKVKDPETGEGDIAIQITGLRPGEKLHEELLVDDTLCATPHPKILRAEEAPMRELEVASLLRDTTAAIAENDPTAFRRIVEARVDGYHIEQAEAAQAN
ncbi:nucleoside-diphosphate sugar epimerase/dehydratase [Yoonia sp. 2307UL14-13]|uniref:nucleoside-diphosphate sugar epimerase/dehydratase n=1 Tax=Yoonia sp. 2307UL14-13 TaxID=3126506 RepID=UPI0030B52B57